MDISRSLFFRIDSTSDKTVSCYPPSAVPFDGDSLPAQKTRSASAMAQLVNAICLNVTKSRGALSWNI
jgi:hypothetical protein